MWYNAIIDVIQSAQMAGADAHEAHWPRECGAKRVSALAFCKAADGRGGCQVITNRVAWSGCHSGCGWGCLGVSGARGAGGQTGPRYSMSKRKET